VAAGAVGDGLLDDPVAAAGVLDEVDDTPLSFTGVYVPTELGTPAIM